MDVLELVLEVVVVDALHHVEAVAHQVVPHLVEVVVLVVVAAVALQAVAIHVVNNEQEHAAAVVRCVKMFVLVVMGAASNTVQAVRLPALDNATFLAKDTMIFSRI